VSPLQVVYSLGVLCRPEGRLVIDPGPPVCAMWTAGRYDSRYASAHATSPVAALDALETELTGLATRLAERCYQSADQDDRDLAEALRLALVEAGCAVDSLEDAALSQKRMGAANTVGRVQ